MAIIIFLFAELNTHIDSLKNVFKNSPDLQAMIALNCAFRSLRMLDSANIYMKRYESQFGFEEQAQLNYLMGDNLLFKAELLSAREQYLRTAAKYANANYANEALARLHLIETARKDTVLLKRLTTGILLYEIKDTKSAEDSLKNLVKTVVGDYALYYLALVFVSKGEQNMVLATLEQLEQDFSGHRIHSAKLLMAETYMSLGKRLESKKMLEALIIKYPNSPSAIRARELLKQLK